jgi:hypothetical protein
MASAEDLLTNRVKVEGARFQKEGESEMGALVTNALRRAEVESNKEAGSCQPKVTTKPGEQKTTQDSTTNCDETTIAKVDVAKNLELEWKVSERKPIHMCERASNSKDEGCVFALCGHCFKPPDVGRCAGRKRTQRVMTEEKGVCKHEDVNTLLSFEAPSFFNEKYRANPLKHFPTKCAVCWIADHN